MNAKVTELEKFDCDKKQEYKDQCIKQGCKIESDENGNMIINKLVLNEVFLAEKDASKTSTYKF